MSIAIPLTLNNVMTPYISISPSRGDQALGRADAIREAVRTALPDLDAGCIQIADVAAERDLTADGLSAEQVRMAWAALLNA